MVEVRPFARSDREQLAELANAHIATAMPGASVPASTMLNQLERPIGEFIIGPWVSDLATLVAVERDRVVAAAHMRRYADDERVSEGYRNSGEIAWLLCWPDELEGGRAVRDAALALLAGWGVNSWCGDGALPVAGVDGVSDAWPVFQRLYEEAGFDAGEGQVEIVYAGTLDGFPDPGEPPLEGLTLRRELGPLGTAFNAILDGGVVGSFEVEADLTRGGTNLALSGWADECNHWVREDLRGRSIGTWLAANAAEWMRLGGTTRLLAYAIEDENIERCTRYYARYGLRPINRTVRGWCRAPEG